MIQSQLGLYSESGTVQSTGSSIIFSFALWYLLILVLHFLCIFVDHPEQKNVSNFFFILAKKMVATCTFVFRVAKKLSLRHLD